jgi:ABC-2 type transport system permease protein
MAGPDAPMRTTEVIGLVAGREIRERLRTRSFWLLTGALVLVILAIGVGSRFVDEGGPGTLQVGIVEPAPAGLADRIGATADAVGRGTAITGFDDAGGARAALDDGDVDAVVVAGSAQVLFADAIDGESLVVLQQAWSSVAVERALSAAGLSPDESRDALSTSALEAVTLDGDSDDTGFAVLTGTAAAILLFISLQTFGGHVLTGVVEEKSSAVVELLLVRATADQILAGKIIGIGVAAMLQFALAVIAAMASLAISGVEVPGEIWSAVPMTLVWFLGGYALYSTLFATAGALVSRQEEAQAASAPILTALIGAYMLVFVFGYIPESTASRVMSLIPPIAPLLMPMRMAAGAASVVEVVVALVLLVAATLGAWKLAGRIFELVLLRRGARISWRGALSLLRGA